jgi:hypothetical protein
VTDVVDSGSDTEPQRRGQRGEALAKAVELRLLEERHLTQLLDVLLRLAIGP